MSTSTIVTWRIRFREIRIDVPSCLNPWQETCVNASSEFDAKSALMADLNLRNVEWDGCWVDEHWTDYHRRQSRATKGESV